MNPTKPPSTYESLRTTPTDASPRGGPTLGRLRRRQKNLSRSVSANGKASGSRFDEVSAMSAVDCKQETSPRPGTPGLARVVEALDDGEAQGDPSLDVSSGRSISERGCCLKEKFSIDVMLGTLF